MDPRRFSFSVVALDEDDQPERLRGNAFPVTEDGGLLTCRHVVDAPNGIRLALIDRETGHLRRIEQVVLPQDTALDLAFLPAALQRSSRRFPILSPGALVVGEDVYSYGFYSPSGRAENMADGFFKGNVVSFRTAGYVIVTLSYPVIEGLSGSPVLTYHNGIKAVGICFGSESQRVLASEIVDVEEGETRYRETVNRVVEFGLAYRSEVMQAFLTQARAQPIVTSDRFDPDELDS